MTIAHETYTHLDLELDDEVLMVRLNRPESLNAVNGPLHTDLSRLFATLRHEQRLGAVVLTGAGRAFCAGGDATWMRRATPADMRQMYSEARTIVRDLTELAMPVVSALNGPTVGFGATLALLCDVVIAEDSAFLTDPHVSMGVVAGDGGAAIWATLVGVNRAKEYLMTGDRLSAAEAERIGLVNRVVPDGEALAAAQALARRLADGPREAISGTKRSINQILRQALEASFETSLALERLSMSTGDYQEALTAFAEARDPDFREARHRAAGTDEGARA